MSDTKKPDANKPDTKQDKFRESVDYAELTRRDQARNSVITNTLPAPPNPHQGGGDKEKK